MQIVDIHWEGPFRLKYNRKNDVYIPPKNLPKSLTKEASIYQIYGKHLVYGRNALLYIGKTERDVIQRLKEHLEWRFFDATELSIHLGRLHYKNDEIIHSTKLIQAVESLLIVAHKPAMNRQFLDCPNDDAKKILVRNWGLIGDILPECSGGYWSC